MAWKYFWSPNVSEQYYMGHGLTQRAADKWDSARFIGIFRASGLYCPQAESTLRPLAGNADRWA
jgi:hypothetical protein